MSKASAFRRMTAARLARKVPETLQLLRSGQLCLTTLCLLREVLTPERASELLSLAANRSEEQVKVLVASLRPQASPTQGVRKLPTRGGALPAPESPSSGAKLAARAHGCAGPEPAQSTATPGAEAPALAQRSAPSPLASPEPPSPRATLRPLDAKRHALRMLVDASFMAELQEARQLEFHHEQAFSTGGAHSARNLRLCCSSHHGLLTERACGADFVARYRSSARTVAGVPPSVPNNLQSEDACSQPSAVPRGPRDFLIRVEIHRPTGNV